MELPYNFVLLVIGSFLGVSLGIFLLVIKSERNVANAFLGVYLLSISLIFVTGSLYRLQLLEQVPHIIYLQLSYNWLVGPLTYLYVRACTEQGFTLKRVHLWHALPFVIGLLYYFPVYLQSGAEKFAYYGRFVTERDSGAPLWFNLINATVVFLYFGAAIRLVRRYKRHLANEASAIDHTYHRWLVVFTSAALLPVLIIPVWIFAATPVLSRAAPITFLFLFLFAVYLVALLKPAIFHRFPNRIERVAPLEEERRKYEHSNLRDRQKEKFAQQLLQAMDEHMYREKELTLSGLAEHLQIPHYYLSQVINERFDCHFLDFVNRYRVADAQRRLRAPEHEMLTILAIAYDAGFNSKTAFYTAFKKQTGMTPSAYRRAKEVGA